MDIRADFSGLDVIEKVPTTFGNSAHISIQKKLIGKKVKIIIGKSTIKNKELNLDFFNSEILERKVKAFGTGAHIILPKQYSNKKVKILVKNE
jgi:putative transposon-encoded protein